MLTCFSPVQLFAIPWTVAHQAPLSIEFPVQEYWSGLPFPSPGGLPDPGIEPMFLTSPALAARFFTTGWEDKIKLTEMTQVKMPGTQHMLGKR